MPDSSGQTTQNMKLSDFKVLTFDCYGTLIDWETGMLKALNSLTCRTSPTPKKDDILQAHARLETDQERQTPTKLYRDLLAVVYKRLAEEWQVSTVWEDCVTYGNSIPVWQPFPDSVESLHYLKKHFKLVILSNVDNRSFAASNELLDIQFDAVFTAEDMGSYKPSDVNFTYMLRHLESRGYTKNEILHVAESLYHDHVPARRHGLHTCRIFRRYDQEGFGATMAPGGGVSWDFLFHSMSELVEAHRKEMMEKS